MIAYESSVLLISSPLQGLDEYLSVSDLSASKTAFLEQFRISASLSTETGSPEINNIDSIAAGNSCAVTLKSSSISDLLLLYRYLTEVSVLFNIYLIIPDKFQHSQKADDFVHLLCFLSEKAAE